MRSSVQLRADSGLVVATDAAVARPQPTGAGANLRDLLRQGEADGRWFWLDVDDPVTYRIALCVDEDGPAWPAHRLQRLGGTFLLRLESGALTLVDGESWSHQGGPELRLAPGAYALSVLGPAPFDGRAYDAEMVQVVGAHDWRHRARIDRLGLLGCLATAIAALLVLLPWTRPLWWLGLALLAAGWLPHLALQRTARYRDIAARVRAHEASLPHVVLQLRRSDASQDLAGGHLHLPA